MQAELLVVGGELEPSAVDFEQRLDAEVREQLALLADAGGEHAFLDQLQVLLLGIDAGGDDLGRALGLFDCLAHARAALGVEAGHADEVVGAGDDGRGDLGGLALFAFVLLRRQDLEAGGLGDRAEAGEGADVDRLLDEAEHGDLAAASAEGFEHGLALAHAEVVPIGADERQALALRDVGIDADDRDAAIDRAVDDRRASARGSSRRSSCRPACGRRSLRSAR